MKIARKIKLTPTNIGTLPPGEHTDTVVRNLRLRVSPSARTFGVDVLACPKCQGRMKLLAMVTDPASIARYLAASARRPKCRAAPRTVARRYWKSRVLRRLALGHDDGRGRPGGDEAA